MTSEHQPDRRKKARVGRKDGERPVTVAHYFLLSDPRMRLSSAPVLDLSADGVCIQTPDEVPVGANVQLLIEPVRPEGVSGPPTMGGSYRLLAEVRWVETASPGEHMIGLVFLDVSTAEARNRKGLQGIMGTYEDR